MVRITPTGVFQGKSRSRGRNSPAVYVAIPVKNEERELEGCLDALARQRDACISAVVLCLNNCTDASGEIVRRLIPTLPYDVSLIEVELPAGHAFAGTARQLAMDRAASLAGANDLLLTTDADGRVAEDWVANTFSAICAGADAVAGRAEIDPIGAKLIPPHLHVIDAQECAYAALLDEIRWHVDPCPDDPWPRHTQHSGASIAVTVPAYHHAGGMQPASVGEDRAFFRALQGIDARVRHAPDVRVVVSARTVGRAAGGMADTIRRRLKQPDQFIDDRLEPAEDAARRARLSAQVRRVWQKPSSRAAELPILARILGISVDELESHLRAAYFGAAWQAIERRSLALQRRRVALLDLQEETERALAIRNAVLMRRPRLLENWPAAISDACSVPSVGRGEMHGDSNLQTLNGLSVAG